MKGALKIQSPSKVFAEFGSFSAQGFQAGLQARQNQTQAVTASMFRNTAEQAAASPAAQPSGEASAMGGGGVSVVINMSGSADESSAAMVAREVETTLQRFMMEGGFA